MTSYPPSHFQGWTPIVQHDCEKFNKKWATDEKFEHLGRTFATFLQNSVTNLTNGFEVQGPLGEGVVKLGDSGLFLKGNSAHLQRGSYTYKRFVRIGADGYHPNGLQIFIECYTGGTQLDNRARDDTDPLYNKVGFPIPKEHFGIFIGMSALLDSSSKGDKNWRMLAREIDAEFVNSDFNIVDDLVKSSNNWALEFTGDPEQFKILRDSRVSRLRIKLPNQSLEADDWSQCRIVEGLEYLVSTFGEQFIDFSRV